MFLSKTTKLLLLITTTSLIILSGVFLIVKKDKQQPVNTNQSITEEQKETKQPNNNQPETTRDEELTNPNNQPTEPSTNQPNQEPTTEDQNITELDTSNWKTYTNEEFGFSFKYPGEWYLETCGRNDMILIDDYKFSPATCGSEFYTINILITNKDPALNNNPGLGKELFINGKHLVQYSFYEEISNTKVPYFFIKAKPGVFVELNLFPGYRELKYNTAINIASTLKALP